MLGNFAAGALMLVLRPIKAGDFASVGGVTGTVHELGLFGTTPVTPDNIYTLVGNSKVLGDNIVNYSTREARRVERTAQLDGSVDPLVAIEMLKVAIAKIPNVVASAEPAQLMKTQAVQAGAQTKDNTPLRPSSNSK